MGIVGLTISTITKHVSHDKAGQVAHHTSKVRAATKNKERRRGGAEESRLPSAAPMHKQGQSAFARSSPPAGDEAGTEKKEKSWDNGR